MERGIEMRRLEEEPALERRRQRGARRRVLRRSRKVQPRVGGALGDADVQGCVGCVRVHAKVAACA